MRRRPPRRGPGRPPKLTTVLRERILALVRAGVGSGRAARMAGVHPDTLGRWTSNKPDFAEQLMEAREVGLGTLEEIVHREARVDLPTARWLLERKLPEEYGRPPSRVQATATVDIEEILAGIDCRRAIVAASERTDVPGISASPKLAASVPAAPRSAPKAPPAPGELRPATLALTLESVIPAGDEWEEG